MKVTKNEHGIIEKEKLNMASLCPHIHQIVEIKYAQVFVC